MVWFPKTRLPWFRLVTIQLSSVGLDLELSPANFDCFHNHCAIREGELAFFTSERSQHSIYIVMFEQLTREMQGLGSVSFLTQAGIVLSKAKHILESGFHFVVLLESVFLFPYKHIILPIQEEVKHKIVISQRNFEKVPAKAFNLHGDCVFIPNHTS